MRTNAHDLVGIRVGLPIRTSDHSAFIIDVVIMQPILQLECRQEVYLKNTVDWELISGDGKSLGWNESTRSSCLGPSLNEALLRILKMRFD